MSTKSSSRTLAVRTVAAAALIAASAMLAVGCTSELPAAPTQPAPGTPQQR